MNIFIIRIFNYTILPLLAAGTLIMIGTILGILVGGVIASFIILRVSEKIDDTA